MGAVSMQMQDLHNLKANEWVLSWLQRLKPQARVLDFASGSGRHALAAFDLGMVVSAWDQDAPALNSIADHQGDCGGANAGDRVLTQLCDLEGEPWPEIDRKFDAVVVTNYLFRPRLVMLADLLSEGGVLIYQTFAQGHEKLGRPRRSDFLLRPGELFFAAQAMGLHVLSFEDSVVNTDEGKDRHAQGAEQQQGQPVARVQRLAAMKCSPTQATPEALRPWPVNIPG
jgi:SAM-dependent methyltransferase